MYGVSCYVSILFPSIGGVKNLKHRSCSSPLYSILIFLVFIVRRPLLIIFKNVHASLPSFLIHFLTGSFPFSSVFMSYRLKFCTISPLYCSRYFVVSYFYYTLNLAYMFRYVNVLLNFSDLRDCFSVVGTPVLFQFSTRVEPPPLCLASGVLKRLVYYLMFLVFCTVL